MEVSRCVYSLHDISEVHTRCAAASGSHHREEGGEQQFVSHTEDFPRRSVLRSGLKTLIEAIDENCDSCAGVKCDYRYCR